jgi:Flp pilus assembly protein CpaB
MSRLSLTTWAVLIGLMLGAAGWAVLQVRNNERHQVLVAVRDVPAFTVINADDVAPRTVPRRSTPDGAVTSLQDVVGHFATRTLNVNKPIPSAAVGGLAGGAANDAVLALDTDDASVSPGQRVDLLLAPVGNTRAAPVVVPRALVVDASHSRVVVAVPRATERDIASVAGRAKVILVPTTS